MPVVIATREAEAGESHHCTAAGQESETSYKIIIIITIIIIMYWLNGGN